MTGRMTNWAGNVTFSAARVHRPTSVEQLREVIGGGERLRALGTGHSFNRIADSTGDLVSVADLPPTIEVDAERRTVAVGAGIRYGRLTAQLHEAGFALHNLGSLPHISIGGACATGTHGSGTGNLSTAVSALELVTADGELVTLSRDADGDRFPGAVIALGCLGVVTALTLDVEPTYDVAQEVYDDVGWDAVRTDFEEIFASGYSVSLFTDWTGPGFKQLWLKRRVDGAESAAPASTRFGGTLADGPRHPIAGMAPENCTQQLGVVGPWHARLPHFRLEFTPSSGEELQSEYLVPRRSAVAALAAIHPIRDRVAAVVQVSEIRTVAADELWLSPSYRRDSVALHFTWIKDADAVAPVVAAVEERLAPFEPRPHWGKVFGMDPDEVKGRYERLADFAALSRALDPTGKFRNTMVDRYL